MTDHAPSRPLSARLASQNGDTLLQRRLEAAIHVLLRGALPSDPRWAESARGRRHLTMLPPIACGQSAGSYLPFQLFAAEHRLTLNTGYPARWNLSATQQYRTDLAAQMQAGAWSAEDLYVLGPDARWRAFLEQVPPLSCRKLDEYEICVVAVGGKSPAL